MTKNRPRGRSSKPSAEIKIGDLRGFHRDVARVVHALVQQQGVKCRMLDGTHVLLYPPDGRSRPFKVSADRKPSDTLKFIASQFCKPHHLEMP